MALLSGAVGEPDHLQIDAALDDIEARAAQKPKFLKSIYLLSSNARSSAIRFQPWLRAAAARCSAVRLGNASKSGVRKQA
jgi:hypothetical protein